MKKHRKSKRHYSDNSVVCEKILKVDNSGLLLKCENSDVFIRFDECAKNYAADKSCKSNKCVATRDITKLTFTFYTDHQIKVIFKKHFLKDLFPKNSAVCKFRELQNIINRCGYTSCDLS